MSVKQTLRLYKVTVPAEKYNKIKTITDILVGETRTNEYLNEARTRCAKIALAAVIEAGQKGGR